MMICTNGKTHTHETVLESKICYGLILPPVPAVRPHEVHRTWRDEPISSRQLAYIVNILGGDENAAKCMDQGAASTYIDNLKRGDKPVSSEPVAVPWSPPAPPKKFVDPRLALVTNLVDIIPDGYFATQTEEGAPITFLRLSRPKRNKLAGATKLQTQHGPSLETEAVLWPSGNWSIYRPRIIDELMLLVVDYRNAALRYAHHIGKCCRCNSPLTDERSRHYGIGPICDQVWLWVIEMVDEQNDGKSWEQLSREPGYIPVGRVV